MGGGQLRYRVTWYQAIAATLDDGVMMIHANDDATAARSTTA